MKVLFGSVLVVLLQTLEAIRDPRHIFDNSIYTDLADSVSNFYLIVSLFSA